VGGGVGDHLLDQLAVLLLDVGAAAELAARLGEAVGERVSDLLEILHPEDARAPHRRLDAPLDPGAREGRAEEARQLCFELCDLAAQVGARAALVGLGDRGLEGRQNLIAVAGHPELVEVGKGHPELDVELVQIASFGQLGHNSPLSGTLSQFTPSSRCRRATRPLRGRCRGRP